jgi:hypothetical protein
VQEASPVCFQSNSSGAGADSDKDFRIKADPPSRKLPPTFDFGVTSRQGSRLGQTPLLAQLAKAFKAIEVGREAREIGLAEKLNAASATSPLTGFLTKWFEKKL